MSYSISILLICNLHDCGVAVHLGKPLCLLHSAGTSTLNIGYTDHQGMQ